MLELNSLEFGKFPMSEDSGEFIPSRKSILLLV